MAASEKQAWVVRSWDFKIVKERTTSQGKQKSPLRDPPIHAVLTWLPTGLRHALGTNLGVDNMDSHCEEPYKYQAISIGLTHTPL